MMINDHIEYLHRIITGVMSGDIISLGIFNKLFSLGVVSIFQTINKQLEELNTQLDSELNLEAVSINFDLYCRRDYWNENWLFVDKVALYEKEGIDLPLSIYTSEINQLTDYLPNEVKGYHTTPEVLDSFKTSMHQLCDDDRMYQKDLFYALSKGLDRMLILLDEIRKKVESPKNHLFIKLWEDTLDIYDNDEFDKDYKDWIEDNGEPSFEELKARQNQEIFKFLNKNFLRFCKIPTGAEIKRRKLIINEDDLPYGTQIPEGFPIECAKFEKFIEWKEEHILSINYEKLGQYIYKYYHQFDELEFFHITDFDRILDVIHEAMAKIKPNLSKYLKRYEDNQIYELKKDCTKIINTCKPFIKKGIRETILEEYVDKIMYNKDIKAEVRSKLGGQSKIKYICDMIAHLSNSFVFDVKYNAEDYAKALRKEISTVEQSTLIRYIKNSINSREGALYSWTKANINDLLSLKPQE